MTNLKQINQSLKKAANPELAKIFQRFFKTRKGEYDEGDVFLGITVPEQRKIANDINYLNRVAQTKLARKVSLLKVTYNHGINIIVGFNEINLNRC